MVKASVDQVVKKWTDNTKNATGYMTQGVQNCPVNPMEIAAQRLDKARTNYVARIDDGTMAAQLRKVTKQQWQDAMINKGVGRVSAGVDAAQAKTMDAFGKLLPYIQKGQDVVNKMPATSLQDSKNRLVAWFDHMAAYKKA